jgi:hypothetical protein
VKSLLPSLQSGPQQALRRMAGSGGVLWAAWYRNSRHAFVCRCEMEAHGDNSTGRTRTELGSGQASECCRARLDRAGRDYGGCWWSRYWFSSVCVSCRRRSCVGPRTRHRRDTEPAARSSRRGLKAGAPSAVIAGPPPRFLGLCFGDRCWIWPRAFPRTATEERPRLHARAADGTVIERRIVDDPNLFKDCDLSGTPC